MESVSLGWNKPIHIEGVILKGPNSSAVLLIPEYKTNAHLWTLVVGRAGLGTSCEYCFLFVRDQCSRGIVTGAIK